MTLSRLPTHSVPLQEQTRPPPVSEPRCLHCNLPPRSLYMCCDAQDRVVVQASSRCLRGLAASATQPYTWRLRNNMASMQLGQVLTAGQCGSALLGKYHKGHPAKPGSRWEATGWSGTHSVHWRPARAAGTAPGRAPRCAWRPSSSVQCG